MIHITEQQIEHVLTDSESIRQVVEAAFVDLEQGQAAQQLRMRTEAQEVKLSTLGAVIPGQGIVGAKVYTTIRGKFTFLIVLFSTETGEVLATLDAGIITKKRTAACSVLMAQQFAWPESKKLAVLGLGTQGLEHFLQLTEAFELEEVHIVSPHLDVEQIAFCRANTTATVSVVEPEQAVQDADIIVTASRSELPIVHGEWLKPGAFIAAIGSSLPHTRELDDEVICRVSRIVVESKEQALAEAGDLVLAKVPNLEQKIQTMGEVLLDKSAAYQKQQIVLYKAVGVALEDIAVAGLVYKKLMQEQAL